MLAQADLGSPEGRARAAERALPVIAEHPSDLVRDQYVMEVADRCRAVPERLRAGLADAIRAGKSDKGSRHHAPASASRGGRAEQAEESTGSGRRPRVGTLERGGDSRPGSTATATSPGRARRGGDGTARRVEVEALRLAVHRPEEVADRMEEVLFSDEVNLAAFRALVGASTLHEAIDAAAPDAAALLQRLAVEETDADPDDVIALLVKQAVTRAIVELEACARESVLVVPEVAQTLAWLKPAVEQLHDSDNRIGACDRLVAWLVQRGEEDA